MPSAKGAENTKSAKKVPLAARLQGFGSTIFAEMSQLAEETGAINLGQGFPDFDGPPEVIEAAIAAIRDGHNQYPPGIGIKPLRDAVSAHQKRFYGLSVDADSEVLITAGATEAIAASLLSLCETGDEVIAFEPFYDSYAACISMAGGKRLPVTLRPPDVSDFNGSAAAPYTYDFEKFEELCARDKARIILLNSPHNPTGKVFTKSELEHIAKCAVKYDLLVITDEVYEHLTFGCEHIPIATLANMAGRTVTISSGGKTFSCTGWKIGWVHSTPELTQAVRMSKQFLTYVNGAPFQHAMAVGLNLGEDYFKNLALSFTKKRDLLYKGLVQAGFKCFKPEGTYFITTDISSFGISDGMEFCRGLPEMCNIVAVPNVVFYDDKKAGAPMVRFAFCKKDSVLAEAVQNLAVSNLAVSNLRVQNLKGAKQ